MHLMNLHIYPSPFKFETRILKETNSIIKLDLASQIIIISTREKNQPREENITSQIKVIRLKNTFTSLPNSKIFKALSYIEFYTRAILFGLQLKIDVINCHSLMVLPVGALLKKLKKAKLIYDPHELETERLGLSGISQRISKWVEKELIHSSDAVIVVGESIHKWYESTYNLSNIYTIRNIPYDIPGLKGKLLREIFGIPSDHIIFIYQGLLVEGRNIDLYINTFKKSEGNKHLVLMGYGPLEAWVKDMASELPNIHFHPAVKPEDVLKYTCSADVGLCLIENCCLSYYYCLPNKFFEYLMAEIPVIVSNFPDMAHIVNAYNIGWPTEISETNLFNIVEQTTVEKILHATERIQVLKSKNMFSWENEELTLKNVFKRIYAGSFQE